MTPDERIAALEKQVQQLAEQANRIATPHKARRSPTAIEYGLIAALIAVAVISAMQGLGSQLQSTFDNVEKNFSDQN